MSLEREFCHEVLIRQKIQEYMMGRFILPNNGDELPMPESRFLAECLLVEKN